MGKNDVQINCDTKWAVPSQRSTVRPVTEATHADHGEPCPRASTLGLTQQTDPLSDIAVQSWGSFRDCLVGGSPSFYRRERGTYGESNSWDLETRVSTKPECKEVDSDWWWAVSWPPWRAWALETASLPTFLGSNTGSLLCDLRPIALPLCFACLIRKRG